MGGRPNRAQGELDLIATTTFESNFIKINTVGDSDAKALHDRNHVEPQLRVLERAYAHRQGDPVWSLSAKESERLSVIDIEYPETMSVPYVENNDRFLSDFHTGMSSDYDLVKKVQTILISVPSIAISSARHVKKTWPSVPVILESSS